MTKDEIIEHNITLTFDFLRQMVKDPSIIDDVEDNSIIEFIENDRPIIETKKPRNRTDILKLSMNLKK